MNELIMLVGLPASGKSTWAKEYSETHPDYIVHSSDKLREECMEIIMMTQTTVKYLKNCIVEYWKI